MSNIEMPCPSCGNTTLFLDNTRRLVCSWIQCKQPVVQEQMYTLAAELAAANEELKWWRNLVTRASIGTTRTPSLKAYVKQLKAELATVKAELDSVKNCRDHQATMLNDYVAQVEHWKQEAVWAARILAVERKSQWADIYDVAIENEQVQRQLAGDTCYQRAQAVLKEA